MVERETSILEAGVRFSLAAHLSVLGDQASAYESDWRGSTPRREAMPSSCRHCKRELPTLVEEGSTPFEGMTIIWVWLNLVEHQFGELAVGSSNLPTQTICTILLLFLSHLGVAQPGRAPVLGTGDWGFESLRPDCGFLANNAPLGECLISRRRGGDPAV